MNNKKPDDRLGVFKIHYPLARALTDQRRRECTELLRERRRRFQELNVTSVLMTDHNTHSGMPNWGGIPLYELELDYVGKAPAPEGAHIEVLERKRVSGTIDGHDFIGARCLVTWPSGRKNKIWFVQANLGRGVSIQEFTNNAKRIKKAFRGHFIIGLDEIDEADFPEEHEILAHIWNPNRCTFVGWGTMSPMIVSRRLRVARVKIMKACDGLSGITPARPLVEAVVLPPKSLNPLKRKD